MSYDDMSRRWTEALSSGLTGDDIQMISADIEAVWAALVFVFRWAGYDPDTQRGYERIKRRARRHARRQHIINTWSDDPFRNALRRR